MSSKGLKCSKCGAENFNTLISFQGSPSIEEETEEGFCWECTKAWIDKLFSIERKKNNNNEKRK
jgi:hypothetical protein